MGPPTAPVLEGHGSRAAEALHLHLEVDHGGAATERKLREPMAVK